MPPFAARRCECQQDGADMRIPVKQDATQDAPADVGQAFAESFQRIIDMETLLQTETQRKALQTCSCIATKKYMWQQRLKAGVYAGSRSHRRFN